MATNITSRRALLRAATTVTAYAAGAAIVGTGLAVASEVKASTVPAISPELAKRIADTRHANARIHRYNSLVVRPAEVRTEKLIGEVPHVTTELCGSTASTSSQVDVAVARAFVGTAHDRTSEMFVAHQAFVAAAHNREQAIRQCRVVSGQDAAGERSDSLCDDAAHCERLVFNFPVRSLVDLEAKLAFIVGEYGFEVDGTAESVLADARRLSGRA